MEFSNKKEHVLRCVKLGMELYKACVIAECTEQETELLTDDEQFNRRIEANVAIEELNLLEKLELAIDVGVSAGKSSGIQWKLERINPGRWSTREGRGKSYEGKVLVFLEGEDAETGS